ncbi:class I SAM-dependent methyltransferase [Bacillus sp. AK031]
MERTAAEVYDNLAETYKNDIDGSSHYNSLYERPAMMELLPHKLEGMKILDAGCAAGWYSQTFIRNGAGVTALDISEKMVKAAKERLSHSANVIQHDLREDLPFEDNQFDIIVSSLTLHYIENWNSTFREFSRVLKPGGTFLYSVHHPFMDFSRHKPEDYFETVKLSEIWNKPNLSIEVSFYRRPLQNIINMTTNHFHLLKLIEPQPLEKLRKVKEKSYRYLMTKPHFLIVKARSGKETEE